MAYGMTHRQFWDGPVDAHRAYRKAHKLAVIEQNTMAWIQGKYVYDAIYSMVPVLRAFSKARKPEEYLPEPYDLYPEQVKAKEADEARAKYENIKEKVAVFATEFNKQRLEQERKEAIASGRSVDQRD